MPQLRAGLNMSPGVNSPESYQTMYESNLDNIPRIAAEQAGAGSEMIGAGRGWGNRANQMFGQAAGIASKEPSWLADRAAVTSNQAFDESKGVQDRALSRMGINPNSGRFVGLQTQWGLARAAAEAGARTKASQEAEQNSFGRLQQLLSQAQHGQGLMGAGVSALGAGQAGFDTAGKQYAGLAQESAQNRTAKQEAARVALQSKADKMIEDMRFKLQASTNTPYGQQDPVTGQIRYHPEYLKQHPGLR